MRNIVILAAVVLMALWLFWRERRSRRWNDQGRCYQCGNALGFDFRSVKLRFEGGSTHLADYCARCARRRLVWGWLVAVLVVVLAGVMAYHLSHVT